MHEPEGMQQGEQEDEWVRRGCARSPVTAGGMNSWLLRDVPHYVCNSRSLDERVWFHGVRLSSENKRNESSEAAE